MESPAKMIVHSPGGHFAKREQIHFQRTLPGFVLRIAPVKSRQKIKRDRTREFRRSPEAAFFVVETPRKLFVGGLKKLIVDLSCACRLGVLRFAKSFYDFGSLPCNFFVVLFPSGRDAFENFCKTGLAVSIFRRKISSADEGLQIGREPDTHRPTAAARRRLNEDHVNAI